MAVRPILVRGNPVLHQKAKRITTFDKNLHKLVDDMIETMRAAPGVGLAGPQVGVPLRLAVIEVEDEVIVIANPEIVKREGEHQPEEGCLSVPGYWGKVGRAEKVTVRARDKNGREFRRTADGLLAQAFQHEIDHLDGTLYLDRMREQNLIEDELRRVEPIRKREAEAAEKRRLLQQSCPPEGEV